VAAFGKVPFTIGLGLRPGLVLDDLFRGPAEVFGHAQVKLRGQSLDLLVSRIGQLYFGSFHVANLPHTVGFAQGHTA
jgi:hypothetical protein